MNLYLFTRGSALSKNKVVTFSLFLEFIVNINFSLSEKASKSALITLLFLKFKFPLKF